MNKPTNPNIKRMLGLVGEKGKDLSLASNWMAAVLRTNEQRTHQGKICCDRMPLVMLDDGKRIWQEKLAG